MRVSKPIILYLPELLISELDKYLEEYPPNFKYQRIYFYYVIHHLTVMQIQYKNDEYFYLNKTFLSSVTISNIDRYIKILKNGEFIISDNSYSLGVKSLKYKLNTKLIIGVSRIELKSDCKISQRILKNLNKKKAHYNRLEPHLRCMKDELMKMELDYQGANKWVENNANDSQKLCYLTSIKNIEDKRFRHFKRNKTNKRLDTNLTNLKSDLRQFIVGDYVSIDLKNSQPFLLGILIDTIINNRDTLCCYLHECNLTKTFGIKAIRNALLIHQKEEKANLVNLSLFLDSVLNGTLYDEFIKSYSGEITRKEVKNIMFKVLFSRNEYYYGYKKLTPYESEKKTFASVYPLIYEVAKTLKRKDHRTLPIYLQRLESYLYIDCIAKELVNKGITPFTIHDSVIVKTEHQQKTLDIINGVFLRQIGVIPSFDIKHLNKQTPPLYPHLN
tara:strand:- start:1469 stop:2800 length:1332 start_codon:yes stop_codon:yes gene_type:complete